MQWLNIRSLKMFSKIHLRSLVETKYPRTARREFVRNFSVILVLVWCDPSFTRDGKGRGTLTTDKLEAFQILSYGKLRAWNIERVENRRYECPKQVRRMANLLLLRAARVPEGNKGRGKVRVSARRFFDHNIPWDRVRSLVFYSWCKSLFLTTYKKN